MHYGHFDDEGREYVITRPDTPLPQPHRERRGGQHSREDAGGPVHRHGERVSLP